MSVEERIVEVPIPDGETPNIDFMAAVDRDR